MIISIDETRVVEVAKYANRLNNMKEHKCKSCPTEYEDMLRNFKKLTKHPDDEVLICTEDDKILGVLAITVEIEEKYIEALGGVYAEENYEKIAMEFFEYLKDKYNGFHFDAVYTVENKGAIKFMDKIGATCISTDIEMKIKKDSFKYRKGNKEIIPLSNKYYAAFCRLHDESHPDIYWTGEGILSALDKFDILVAIEKDILVGAVVTSKFIGKMEEVYFIETHKDYRRQGYARSLLEEAMNKAYQSGADELMVVTEVDNIPAINLYESFRFNRFDTCSTYSIDSL